MVLVDAVGEVLSRVLPAGSRLMISASQVADALKLPE